MCLCGMGGCAGHSVLTRWHSRAEYKDNGLETGTCTLGDAASESCYHNDQLIAKAPVSPYPSGMDLSAPGVHDRAAVLCAGVSVRGNERHEPMRLSAECARGQRRVEQRVLPTILGVQVRAEARRKLARMLGFRDRGHADVRQRVQCRPVCTTGRKHGRRRMSDL